MSVLAAPAESPFPVAADAWLDAYKLYIKKETLRSYKQYISTLKIFLQQIPLTSISIGTVREYQKWRMQSAGATRTNAELSVLKQILREANQWNRIGPLYKPLPVPKKKVRQNMSEEEERRLIAVATEKPRRRLAGHCLLIMAYTSMGFGELKNVRRQDVLLDEDPPLVEINGGAKNDYRIRSVPLNFIALRSMRWIVKRWEELGGTSPDQFILPHNAKRTVESRSKKGHARTEPPNFYEPMCHIYKAARGILKDAGLDHLDPYDMRAHTITKLLSDPNVSDQVYEEITGHKGRQMRRRYSKQRAEKKKVATDGLLRNLLDSSDLHPKLLVFPGGRRA